MKNWLAPQETLTDRDVDRGMKMLLFDAAFAHAMNVLTGGAFLVAFALLLGASNKVIGILAAAAPISQMLHIPAIYLVERGRRRKALSIGAAVIARSAWVLAALAPWLAPAHLRIPAFIACLAGFFVFGAVSGCAWNSWMRDLVPEKRMGRFFGKRMAIATALGAVLSFSAGIGIDAWERHFDTAFGAYSILFMSACLSGMLALVFLAFVPEPQMPAAPRVPLAKALLEPFKDYNFRQYLVYVGTWGLSTNFAVPFFAVYMIKRLGLSMTWILGLSVVSQLMNVIFFNVWGKQADRFSNKSVLSLAAPMFLVCFMLWPLTTMPERYALTIPVLVVIHVLGGVSMAGVAICSSNLAFRSAPQGKATSYLAVNGLVVGVAAMVAPVTAGFAADYFENYELAIGLSVTKKEPESEPAATAPPSSAALTDGRTPTPPIESAAPAAAPESIDQSPPATSDAERPADTSASDGPIEPETLRTEVEHWRQHLAQTAQNRKNLVGADAQGETVNLPAMSLEGLDFVFVIAFLLGVLSLHRLRRVNEEGEAGDAAVRQELYREMRRMARTVSTVAGLRQLTAVPYARMKAAAAREKHRPETKH